MRYLLFYSFLLMTIMASAQSELQDLNNLNRDMQRAKSGDIDPSITGTPYWNTDFKKGEILLIDNVIYKNVLMRYDAYNDIIETEQKGQIFRFTHPEKLVYARIGEDTLHYLPYYRGKKQVNSFFYLVEQGNLSLYVKHTKSFKKAQAPIGFQDAIPAAYSNAADQFFFRRYDQDLVAVGSKKEMLTFFDDKEIAAYIKKQKVSPRKGDKLQALVKYYNSK